MIKFWQGIKRFLGKKKIKPKKEIPDLACFLISSMEEDCAYDQPCKYGYRVDGHSVYCENPKMPNRKCHNTWFTGGEYKDEDCEGYKPNEIVTRGG